MTDDELIKLIANIWVDNGGDADGFAWTYLRIKEAIQEEIDRLANSGVTV